MTIVLTVLLAVLKFVGWLLLFLLALLVVLLILPVELRFSYQAGKPSLTAWYGPLHFTLWPRAAAKDTAAQHPAAPQPAPAAQPSAEPALSKTQPAPAATPAGAAAPAAQSQQASVAAKAAPTPAPATEFTGEHPKSSALPFHISERIETALNLLTHDPAAFVRCMFGNLRWVGRFLARHIKVTGEDAAQTAGLYGVAMAAANNLLAFLQQVVCLQCDHLQLEPDFTGQRRGERHISGRLHTHLFLLLWLLIRLLFRLGKDPQLQPAHTN